MDGADRSAVGSLLRALGTAARPQARPRGRRRKAWYSRCCSLKIVLRWAPLVLGVSMLYGSGSGVSEALRGLGRGVNAAANLADDVVSAAGTVTEVGANITVEVADLAVRALSKSKSLVDDAYAGVDIINVNATTSTIRIAAVSPGDLADWVVAGGGGHVPARAAATVGPLLRTIHHRLPLLDFGNASFEERGVFHRWTGKAKVLNSGYSALALSIICVEFDVEWSFFFWEMLEFDARRMHSRVLRNIDALLVDVPSPSPELFVLTDASVDTASLPVLRSSRFASVTEWLGSRVDWESVVLGGFAVGAVTASFVIFTMPRLRAPDSAGDLFFEADPGDEIEQEADYLIVSAAKPPGSPDSAAGPEEESGGAGSSSVCS